MMRFVENVNSGLWNPWLLGLFFLVGGYFSLRSGFFQLFGIKDWIGNTLGPICSRKRVKAAKGRLTQFQAMATALGSTVGTSSIAGVATAIYFGGPGAVFWMWVSAFLGMMTGYAEKVLAIRYRRRTPEGGWKGGPVEYMKRGAGLTLLAKVFCVACILASFSGGNLVQANSIASGIHAAFGCPLYLIGGVVAGLTAIVVLGGIERIGTVSSALVPAMALFFVIGSAFVLLHQRAELPAAFFQIIGSAASPQALLGGGAGYAAASALRYGVARGVFTNEAGLGSSAMAHSVAEVKEPHTQGLWGMLEVFLATLVIATSTALVILTSGIYRPANALRAIEAGLPDPEMVGVSLAVRSYGTVMGEWAGPFIAICLTLFAISSILGWCYYGERCVEDLGGRRGAVFLYRLCFIALLLVGSVADVGAVWEIADLCNGLMAAPNLLALLILSPQVMEEWRSGIARRK